MKGQTVRCAGVLVVVCLLGTVMAFPVVEDENGDLVELIPLRRVPRGLNPHHRSQYRERSEPRPQLVGMPGGGEGDSPYEPIAASSRKEPLVTAETGHGHSHSPYDYVDYGAYTGGYGAFGWYTDHPVYTYGHGGY